MERFTTRKISADERPKFFYEYYVTGRGQFPLDMLRHDDCWPATSSDAALIDKEDYKEHRSILMHSYHEPTVARWQSFVWSVGKEKL